jgi:hypothetical protein
MASGRKNPEIVVGDATVDAPVIPAFAGMTADAGMTVTRP